MISARHLGQAGLRLQTDAAVVYIDPYLSDSVAERHGEELRRLVPAPVLPAQVTDATWVLITHAHLDHCDPDTIVPVSQQSSGSRFLAPQEAGGLLREWGIAADRIEIAHERWFDLGSGFRVHPVPAAHPDLERHDDGSSRFVGYLLEVDGKRIYHAGDTSPHPEIFAALAQLGRIDVALLPVNERNYFRDRAGIIGNMSVREAFQMADEIGAPALVPIHWELFAPNSVYWEEIELLHRLLKPAARLVRSLEEA